MTVVLLSIVLSLLGSGSAFGNDILAEAREFAKDRPDETLALLKTHLEAYPEDVDARVLYGLICSWNKRYDEGRLMLEKVLADKPQYKDAVLALVNLELWSDNLARARQIVEQSLVGAPSDPEYRAALEKVRESERATAVASLPAPLSVPIEVNKSAGESLTWEAGVNASQVWFSDKRSSWAEQSVSLSYHTRGHGSVTARFYRAQRFGLSSNFVEFEAYPRIRKGTYAFLSGGFSPDETLYLSRRFGGEIYQNLPYSMEASAGFRRYATTVPVTMYTGSLGKYVGNWLYTIRTYLVPDNTGVSQSFSFSARRYSGSPDRFIGFRLGYGASPFEVRSANEVEVLHSSSVSLESAWRMRGGFSYRCIAGIAQENRVALGRLWQYAGNCSLFYGF
jgi:YaiO family outer membrane protein